MAPAGSIGFESCAAKVTAIALLMPMERLRRGPQKSGEKVPA